MESDSSDVSKRAELHRMMDMVADKLRAMGGNVTLVDIGEQEVREEVLFINQLIGLADKNENELACYSHFVAWQVILG